MRQHPLLIFFQQGKNVKVILSLWAVRNKWLARFGPGAQPWPTESGPSLSPRCLNTSIPLSSPQSFASGTTDYSPIPVHVIFFHTSLSVIFLTLIALGQEYSILDLRESSHILETSPWSIRTSFSRKLCPCEHPISSPKLPRIVKGCDFMLLAK